jgi:hypothetical protein
MIRHGETKTKTSTLLNCSKFRVIASRVALHDQIPALLLQAQDNPEVRLSREYMAIRNFISCFSVSLLFLGGMIEVYEKQIIKHLEFLSDFKIDDLCFMHLFMLTLFHNKQSSRYHFTNRVKKS